MAIVFTVLRIILSSPAALLFKVKGTPAVLLSVRFISEPLVTVILSVVPSVPVTARPVEVRVVTVLPLT